MDLDLSWLLLALPVTFALGWGAARLDLRQVGRERRETPRAYVRGLSLLLNEQQDKAVDAFIEAVRDDPEAIELHFALGGLFRRRGEFERAVRVHEHLLRRADLKQDDRDRALYALAQDFLRAGLFDRAETAFGQLEGTSIDSEARLALLALHERAREWSAAIGVSQSLQARGMGSFATRIAHHHCELALDADARGDNAEAERHLALARQADPVAARPCVMLGQRRWQRGDPRGAMQAWQVLVDIRPQSFDLVADDYVSAAMACAEQASALQLLRQLHASDGSAALTAGLARLLSSASLSQDSEPDEAAAARLAADHLRRRPSLAGARILLAMDPTLWGEQGVQAVREAVTRAAHPLARYRCAACGFEAQRYFWQCPGCLGWDTFPPRTVEEL